MTAVLIVDVSLHASSVPATYVAPAALQAFGVSATSGSTTGTLNSTSLVTTYGGDTYTVTPGNCVSIGANGDGGIAGYIPTSAGANDATIFPLGFAPTFIEVINETAGTRFMWMLGMTAGHAIKDTFSGPTIVDTASLITVISDASGGLGNVNAVVLAAGIMAGADLVCFRFEK